MSDEIFVPDIEPAPVPSPWERQEGETPHAFELFSEYAELGGERTLRLLAGRRGRDFQAYSMLSRQWRWVERARLWDNHQAEVGRVAKDRATAEHAEKWQRRRLESAEQNWDMLESLREKIESLLGGMVDDAAKLKVTPANLAKLAKLIAMWTALRGAALNEADADSFDPTTATLDDCEAYLERKGVKALPGPDLS